jgi:hypothetical protein
MNIMFLLGLYCRYYEYTVELQQKRRLFTRNANIEKSLSVKSIAKHQVQYDLVRSRKPIALDFDKSILVQKSWVKNLMQGSH